MEESPSGFPIMCLLNRCVATRLAVCTYGIINAIKVQNPYGFLGIRLLNLLR